jgi:hypothetical protein
MKLAVVTGTRTEERRGVISEALRRHGPDFLLVGEARGVDTEAALTCQVEGYDHAIVPALWNKYDRAAGPRRNDLLEFLAAAVAAYTASQPLVFAVPGANSRGTYDCADRAFKAYKKVWL